MLGCQVTDYLVKSKLMNSSIEHIIAHELSVTRPQVLAAIRLFDSGATVPFIARYRKEATGGLTDTHLRMLFDRLEYLRELEEQRRSILLNLEDQGKLTPVLKEALEQAVTKAELEDLYLPFRPKTGSRAQAAREKGLEELADRILKDPQTDPAAAAKAFVNLEKNVPDAAAALSGAMDILTERFSESPALLGNLREKFWKKGWIFSKRAEQASIKEDTENYSDYFDFRQPISQIPSHRFLALQRGQRQGILAVTLETEGYADYDSDRKEKEIEYIQEVLSHFRIELKKRPADGWLLDAAKRAWKYKMRVKLELDILSRLRQKSDEEAIRVFSENLKNLLLTAPAGPRVTMGLDPGYRNGVKAAVVDKTGKFLEASTIFPHSPQEEKTQSKKVLSALIRKHSVELIAIGNGTASRETDQLVSALLKENPDIKANSIVVSEAGASVYSASAEAAKEFPDLDVTLRGAVSIARRLQDPLAELVKIEPKSIGVGQYQHDVNQNRLSKMLAQAVEDCVNAVGVDANTASKELLSYVSGLSSRAAEEIVNHRNRHGLFKNRMEFLKIPEFGPKTFEQAAGFLRIPNGDNPLDRSAVHPESYPVIERILESLKKDLSEILGNSAFIATLDAQNYVDEKFGAPTVRDILQELEKPGRDPRPEFKTADFRKDVTEIKDLKPGMVLQGVVTNVANFGAFVDIGVHQEGLVHISELSTQFIQDPHQVVKAGQLVRVKVLSVDLPRKRIALTMTR